MRNDININYLTNKLPQRSSSALHIATELGDVKIVKLLLKYNAEVNIKDHLGRTPLFYAITNIELTKLLVPNSDLNIVDHLNDSIFDYIEYCKLHHMILPETEKIILERFAHIRE